MSDEWLEQLRQIREADKAKHQAKAEQAPKQDKRNEAGELLRQSRAHSLLRQVQKVLLDGQGQIDIVDKVGPYEQGIMLSWQGPISAARRPHINTDEAYYYILIGVSQGKLWVNGKSLSKITPQMLKAALLEASKNPARRKQDQK